MNAVAPRFGFAISLLIFAGSVFAQSRTFVSAQTGNDLNPCTVTSPCRNFERAIAVVADGGEVVALDSGGYGALTIPKSVTISVPDGIHGAITAPASGPAINITAPSNSQIILRGLAISGTASFTDRTGIASLGTSLIHLYVEKCTITGFDFGIRFFSPGRLSVKDSFIRNNMGAGIWVSGTGAGLNMVDALIDNVRAEFNGHGVFGPASDFGAGAFSEVLVRNSVSLRSFRAFTAGGQTPAGDPGPSKMMIVGSAGTKNYSSVVAGGHPTDQSGTATIVLSDSTITHAEFKGIEIFTNGAIISKGDNVLNNTANDAFSATSARQ